MDPIETRDWLRAIESVIREEKGVERAQYLIDQLLSEARKGGVKVAAGGASNYINTIAVEDEPEYPNVWAQTSHSFCYPLNAIMTVLRASKKT